MSAADGARARPGGAAASTSTRAAREEHALFASAAFLAVCGTILAVGPPCAATQLALLVLAVAVGLPHGALDGQNGKRLFASTHGRLWPLPFLGGYAALFAATLVSWRIAPAAALLAFLAISVVHFGQCDRGDAERFPRLSVLAHGGVPVVLPALAFPRDVERLFEWLVGAQDAALVVGLLAGPVAAAWLAAVAVQTAQWFLEPPMRRNSDEGRTALGVGSTLILLFATVPPLLAFALYFALFHAPRALLQTVGEDREPIRAIGRALRTATPLSVAALAIGVGFLLVLPNDDWAPATVRSVFLLLSGLTVPHMWLEYRLHADTGATAGTPRA